MKLTVYRYVCTGIYRYVCTGMLIGKYRYSPDITSRTLFVCNIKVSTGCRVSMLAISYVAVCRHLVLVGVCMHGVLKQHTRMLSYSSLYA